MTKTNGTSKLIWTLMKKHQEEEQGSQRDVA
jgi:hypothetical protein